jgi:8-oxo-dGTP pyrophosphatase MutT (NUDIX family)
LREAQEEVGIASQFVQVLGSLPTYTTGSAFVVTPVVALLHTGFEISANPDEVADVFEVPLAFLMNPANHRHHSADWQGTRREWISMPYVVDAQKERLIWGATAAMLRNFYRFMLD